MSFNVSADAYGRFMGQFSEPLAVQFIEYAGVRAGQRAVDVGSGPGVGYLDKPYAPTELADAVARLLGEPG